MAPCQTTGAIDRPGHEADATATGDPDGNRRHPTGVALWASTTGTVGWVDEARELLRRARARAETDLTAASGGAPLCRVDPGGTSGTAKYAEGRMAALAEAHRSARAHGLVDTASLLALVGSLLQAWRDAADATSDPGPSWVAYRKGGIAALDDLRDELSALPVDPGAS